MKILGYQITIDQSQTVDELGGVIGRWVVTSQRIQVARDVCPQQAASATLHEVIEALNSMLKLDLSEHQIMSLEAGLYQVLTDNGIDLANLVNG